MASAKTSEISMTKKELANIAGYSYRQLYNIDRELPEGKKLFVESDQDGKKCDLSTFVQRWVEYNINRDADITTLEDAKTAHEIIKTRKTELEVAHMEGALVDVNEIRLLWANIAATVMQNMVRLPSKIAPQLLSIDNIQVIQTIIDKEIRDVLNDIADTPLPEIVHTTTDEAGDGD